MHVHEIYACKHKNSLKQIARCCILEKTKPNKAGEGGLRCVRRKKVEYLLYILAHNCTGKPQSLIKKTPLLPLFTPDKTGDACFMAGENGSRHFINPTLICLKIGTITVK